MGMSLHTKKENWLTFTVDGYRLVRIWNRFVNFEKLKNGIVENNSFLSRAGNEMKNQLTQYEILNAK